MFDRLPYVPAADDLVDRAFRAGGKAARDIRGRKGPRDAKLRRAEEKRVAIIGGIVEGELKSLVKQFPSYDQLPAFYRKLLDIQISKDRYKKSLGAVQWCFKNVRQLRESTQRKMRRERDTALAKQYLGRVSSLVTQIASDLDVLIDIKQKLQSFPSLADDQSTLVIAGYPNVGKSTFLRSLTGSKVQIAAYPFTTTQVQIGRKKVVHTVYQILDVPGLLDRPAEKRNKVEQQAALALAELADMVLFLVDPGQDLTKQARLLEDIRGMVSVPVWVAVNKVDACSPSQVEKVVAVFSGEDVVTVTAQDTGQCEELFNKIISS